MCTMSAADIERYSVWRRKKHGVQPITLRHDLDALSKFFQWGVRMNLAPKNPVKDVEKPSTENAVRMHILTAAKARPYSIELKSTIIGTLRKSPA